MEYKLVWVSLGNADPTSIPFRVDEETGRVYYALPSDLGFGYLAINGVNISGYFKPNDDSMEYSIRRPGNFGKGE